MTTSAPAWAKANTISRPRPRDPPVTSATLPVRSNWSATAAQNIVPVMAEQGSGLRAASAAERRLEDRRRAATAEVERLLDAALRVVERTAPESARVADIVAEAGSSNHSFYRYFASKDDLLLAVLERGIARVQTYAQHQMAKATD